MDALAKRFQRLLRDGFEIGTIPDTGLAALTREMDPRSASISRFPFFVGIQRSHLLSLFRTHPAGLSGNAGCGIAPH